LGVQKFGVECEDLDEEAEYELWVNGVLVETMSSDDDGVSGVDSARRQRTKNWPCRQR